MKEKNIKELVSRAENIIETIKPLTQEEKECCLKTVDSLYNELISALIGPDNHKYTQFLKRAEYMHYNDRRTLLDKLVYVADEDEKRLVECMKKLLDKEIELLNTKDHTGGISLRNS